MGFRPQGNMPLSSVIGPGGMADRNTRSSPFDRYRKSPSPPSAGTIGSRYPSKKEEERSQHIESGPSVGRQRENQRPYESQPAAQKVLKEHKANQQPQKESETFKERTQHERSTVRKSSKENEQQRERYCLWLCLKCLSNSLHYIQLYLNSSVEAFETKRRLRDQKISVGNFLESSHP